MNAGPRRLPTGGRIDRAARLSFTFDGRQLEGFQGDTLASALLANGVDVVGRSFKFGRPRGVVGHGAEEPNAIVQLGRGAHSLPNQRATQVELHDGLIAASSADRRLRGLLDHVRQVLPAGFYYKMFMAPRAWRVWEHVLRRGAGLGTVPSGPDPDAYDKVNRHCDVMVVGAGPAGLAAALAATRSGARVVVADEQNELGGGLLHAGVRIDGESAADWVATAVDELRRCRNVLLLPRSTAVGLYDHGFLTVLERRTDHLPAEVGPVPRQRLHRIRTKQVVLATGAIERPLVFANNDLPGVMLASAVSCYLHRYAVAAGERLVLATNNDSAYATALDWQGAGRQVVAIADSRERPDGALPSAARDAGIAVLAGHGVVEAVGRSRVRGVRVAPLDESGAQLTGPLRALPCDLVASSGGWSPVVHLSSQTGTRPVWSDRAVAFLPGESERLFCAGAVTGIESVRDCLEDGAAAGARAAESAGFKPAALGAPPTTDEASQQPQQAIFAVPHIEPASRAPPQFVDFQLDVTAADIELAAREGYESVEHAKRYTALGFGTDQGKLGNVNGIAILARALGREIADVGTTMFRPAYTPATFGAIAGRDVGDLFDPVRQTPMHGWHAAQGAVWEDVGRWKRPRYYPAPGEDMDAAVARECLAVRHGVGIMDVSTLGKIDIQGSDAARFLDRIYAGGFLKLGVGRCRYGVMLKDDGMVFDDGVTVRLDEHRYLMHTTTGNAEAVFAWLELWAQTEWPELDVYLASVTDHWATAAVVGPKSREVLRRVCTDIDLASDAFPFMTARQGHVADVPARVFRISFSGELAFEVNVPADRGLAVWEALVAAGASDGIAPYGTEAMHVLRAEKGFVIVGQDTDGSMTPHDVGLDWAVRHGKRFGFVGERALALADYQRPDRLQLVGLRSLDSAAVLPEGAQIVTGTHQASSGRVPMHGHVTSSYRSAALGHPIALAMVKGGRDRHGEVVYCPLADGRTLAAEIVEPVFYDPDGERQRG